MEINLTELTSKLYKSFQDENKPRELNNWHASSIAQCPRAQMYARADIPPLAKPTGAKIIRWQSGHEIEGVIRPHLKKLYPNLISNVRFTNEELNLTGEIDNFDLDSKTLIEIKSVSTHAVKYRKVSDDRAHLRDERPYLGHEYQQAAYIALFRHQNTYIDELGDFLDGGSVKDFMRQMLLIKQVIYLYITLDGLLVPYSTPVSEGIVSNVLKRLNVLRAAWKAQESPECLCSEDHPLWKSVMQFCDYRNGSECCSIKLWENRDA